mmetsp:Transcript_31677/g.23479  ORF Transcript_31677/g.23479 Transcript_31677/m.23479 type:complete len:208 (-) Transcript_31677:332-955(-)|eukprot:CAMPEP_0202969174 /NCGR_PEP_ID=MMETSP1396-20130829/14811_1 /ASSEMBLY_ACC=CAM_ASM_000872 /TAXON_ID= /ORGANISM="Pseudokeronopsis sp., Strain Brazil" /LENGTH=207 /DNA_ID=CAMNT_0049696405 /DNA_START=138 /DNA_END=761 /DNA_ORIENTATION=+
MKKGTAEVLLGNLSKPTYLEYDFSRHHLYFCEDEAFAIRGVPIVYEEATDKVHAGPVYLIKDGIDCGDLKLDSFGNLFFVDRSQHFIAKLEKEKLDLATNGKPFNISIIYSQNLTEYLSFPEAITIEREYIYWTNVGEGSENGIIHKAFTDPFVRNLPIQSYTITDLEESYSITANNRYIFFTGLVNQKNFIDRTNQNTTELFMMIK